MNLSRLFLVYLKALSKDPVVETCTYLYGPNRSDKAASTAADDDPIAIDWLQTNKMIIRPGKFQFIIIDKKKQNHTKETFKIGDKVIEVSLSVNLLGVQIDNKLNFNLHITNTACFYHVTYTFQSESTIYSCLRLKGILPRNRWNIWV